MSIVMRNMEKHFVQKRTEGEEEVVANGNVKDNAENRINPEERGQGIENERSDEQATASSSLSLGTASNHNFGVIFAQFRQMLEQNNQQLIQQMRTDIKEHEEKLDQNNQKLDQTREQIYQYNEKVDRNMERLEGKLDQNIRQIRVEMKEQGKRIRSELTNTREAIRTVIKDSHAKFVKQVNVALKIREEERNDVVKEQTEAVIDMPVNEKCVDGEEILVISSTKYVVEAGESASSGVDSSEVGSTNGETEVNNDEFRLAAACERGGLLQRESNGGGPATGVFKIDSAIS